MKIAYFAWGSLLWNSDGLDLEIKWKKTNIHLPLNFSRISDNGRGRLTLVIDNINGVSNPIYYAITKINNLNKAIKNLKIREGTISKYIGYINLKNDSIRYSDRLTQNDIESFRSFAKKHKIDAIIWTDLYPNFKNFSTDNALKYINNHKKDVILYNKMIEYIFLCNVYGNIQTPLTKKILSIKL
jgi:hypothetical protein